MLLFTSDDTARAYREQIMQLHRLSKIHGKHSSLINPNQSQKFSETETLDALFKCFSLVPGYSRLSLRLLKQPFNLQYKQLLKDGGPVTRLQRRTSSENLVLFNLDIGNISLKDVQSFITEDGKRRNMYWKLVGGPGAIYGIDEKSEQEVICPKNDERKNVRQRPSKFVLPFISEYEARRFTREWHRRQFPFHGRRYTEDSHDPVINTEILW